MLLLCHSLVLPELYSSKKNCRKLETTNSTLNCKLSYLPVPSYYPFLRNKFFQSKRASCMQLLCRDPDLCTQPKFFSVGKSCRRIRINSSGINFLQKSFALFFIF